MTDNRTTELLDGLRHVGNLHEFAELFGFDWYDDSDWVWHDVAVKMADDFEQAIAATLGSEREKDLESLVKQLWYLVNHRSGYGYAAALESIEELGIEVDA